MPQPPQLLSSVSGLAHMFPPQQIWPVRQVPATPQLHAVWHPGFMLDASQHTSPLAQSLPVTAQLQLPPMQVSPGLQALPQPPQLAASVIGSMQPFAQQTVPAQLEPLPQRHKPPEQLSLVPQTVPQAPQLLVSISVRVQVPWQQVSSASQTRSPQRWSVSTNAAEAFLAKAASTGWALPIVALGPSARAARVSLGGASPTGGKSVKTKLGANT
jgi:hypothetical protein